jgi:hypothetical protein
MKQAKNAERKKERKKERRQVTKTRKEERINEVKKE